MTLQHRSFTPAPIFLMPEPLSAAQAGDLVRRRREAQGLTQDQLADSLNIDKSYISKLEGGVYHVARSKYFPRIASLLGFSEDDIRIVNPSAVFAIPDSPPQSPRRGGPIPPVIPFRDTPISIPNELLEMVEQYGEAYPVLKTQQMQRMLAAPRAHGGLEVGPQTAEDWFDYWMANKRFLT